ncbi:MAG: metalloprotease [Nitrososphaerota archaeon]|nr:metalloprotease [Nitrososphaerota archaeon]
MNCDYCGKEESLPFVCSYCGGTYCSEHRLPEAHRCTGDLSRRPVKQSTTTTFSWSDGGGAAGMRTPQPRNFSRIEVRDILVAWIALGVAFTIAITGGLLSGFSGRLGVVVNGGAVTIGLETTFVLALVTIGVGFVLHELMHKFVSERYGFKAEFRMWPQGLGFALVSALIAGIVFAAPGATYIMGYGVTERENGIISLAGPLTNIAIALLFLPLLLVNGGNVTLFEAGYLGSYFNFFLATFNMLPIFVLDGAKVWRWNKAIWAGLFIPLVVIVVAYLTGSVG